MVYIMYNELFNYQLYYIIMDNAYFEYARTLTANKYRVTFVFSSWTLSVCPVQGAIIGILFYFLYLVLQSFHIFGFS